MSTFKRNFRDNWQLCLMIAPAIIFFIIFNYVPMVGLILGFKQYNFYDGIFGSPWCGFDNFKFLFASGKAFELTVNTILYNLGFLIVGTSLEVTMAVLLSVMQGKLFKKVTQSLMLLPHFISWVIVGIFVYSIVNFDNGFLNTILKHLGKDPVQLYKMPGAWKYIIIFTYCWSHAGYGSIVFLATIMGFDTTYYEAADIDGATMWQKTRYITLPLLKPIIIIMVLMAFGRIVKGNFEIFYQLIGNNGMLLKGNDIIETYVFRALTSGTDFGVSVAVGIYQSVLSFFMIMAMNWAVKKYESDYALF